MTIITVGIGLAKKVFAVPAVNKTGKLELVNPKVLRLIDSYCCVLPITLSRVAILCLMVNGGKGDTAANK